jgi:predicted TPR repeat methyltransferase
MRDLSLDPAAQAGFHSSGDLIADRRYDYAMALAARAECEAAIDLLTQAVERAPAFASAWFALGEVRERTGDRAGAVAGFEKACATDPADRAGARLRLARLGAADIGAAMPPAYVRTLFDQYAPRFDASFIDGLAYRGPAVLLGAVERACPSDRRPPGLAAALDLGCGTGLAGAAFRPLAGQLTGVDLSPGMIAQARAKGIYDRLEAGDVLAFLAAETAQRRAYDLIFAADLFPYLADLAPILGAAARALAPAGLLAFTTEAHAGDGVVLGDKLRYAHGAAHIRAALDQASLALAGFARDWVRTEAGVPVPGFVVAASKIAP